MKRTIALVSVIILLITVSIAWYADARNSAPAPQTRQVLYATLAPAYTATPAPTTRAPTNTLTPTSTPILPTITPSTHTEEEIRVTAPPTTTPTSIEVQATRTAKVATIEAMATRIFAPTVTPLPTATSTPPPTSAPTPTPVPTYYEVDGWCYKDPLNDRAITKTNWAGKEVKVYPRNQSIHWTTKYGVETSYIIKCELVNGEQICKSDMPRQTWAKHYEFLVNLQCHHQKPGCRNPRCENGEQLNTYK